MTQKTLDLTLPAPAPAASTHALGPFRPTAEQARARELFLTGEPLKIVGYAGAAKTSTLELMARSTRRYGLYLAFNRAIRDDVGQRLPRNVRALTTHSLALRSIDSIYPRGDKLFSTPNANAAAHALGLQPIAVAGWQITPRQQAASALATVAAFCNSADPELAPHHVALTGRLARIDPDTQEETVAHLLGAARALWVRMTAPQDAFPLGHSGYLKLWSLKRPQISADYVLADEAQDLNEATLHVLRAQQVSVTAVGDPNQQIYAWRGAVNAMDLLSTRHTAHLSQSFRFGPELADLANIPLALLGSDRPMRGNPDIETAIGECDPTAVLCRTNAGVISEVVAGLMASKVPHVVGGTGEMVRLLDAVKGLRRGYPSECPELFGYRTWAEVETAVADGTEPGLKILVELVATYGEDQLLEMLARTVPNEIDATLVCSTCHKAKGRAFARVAIAADFSSPERLDEGRVTLDVEELRLLYVAMTRARFALALPPELHQFLEGRRGEADRSWRCALAATPR